jgi:hypothetical protein
VGGEVVEDDDFALVPGGGKLGLDIGLEDDPVHRPIDDERRGEFMAAQPGNGPPVPERRLGLEALAFRTAARQRGILVVVPVSSINTSRCGSSFILG